MDSTPFEDLVSVVYSTITSASIYGVFTNLMPFIASMVLVVLGITVLRRIIKGTSKLRIRF